MQPEHTDFDDAISDNAVLQHLSCNPEFFVDNEDILTRLRVPHASGTAVSLIEKQVSVLRGKCFHLEKSLRDLIAVARENENLHERLHTLIQEIITAPSLNDIVELTRTSLKDNFNAEHVHIMLIAAPPKRSSRQSSAAKSGKSGETRTGKSTGKAPGKLDKVAGATVVRHTDKRVRQFADVFARGGTLCGLPSEKQLLAMVGADHADVASAAIIPLHFGRKLGVVMLTSRDESRFGVGKGVMFLNQMGELLSRRIHSYAAHSQAVAK